jgi:hypothetical protein
MLRTSLTMIICIGATFSSRPAEAGWYEFWHRVHLDFHRNNAWPEPFVSLDRKAQVAPFEVMAEKGWLRQNTIGHHHFDPTSQQLTEAGRHKLHWILTHTPAKRRTVVVVRGETDEMTAIRTDSVQQTAARLKPQGVLPEVLLTDIQPRGWSAEEIDAIGLKAQESRPDPVLPPMQSTGMSGMGGS